MSPEVTWRSGFGESPSSRLSCLALAFLVVCLAVGPLVAQTQNELTPAEKEEFLRTAEVLPQGPGCRFEPRVRLKDGRVTRWARFDWQDVHGTRLRVLADGTRTEDYRDSYRYAIAAYELDKLLGIGVVPVTVERVLEGRTMALSWHIEPPIKMLSFRESLGEFPPDLDAWNYRLNRYWVFLELIHDADRRPINVLLTDDDWNLWKIAPTRSFHKTAELVDEEKLVQIDRELYRALEHLTLESISSVLGEQLDEEELERVLQRRDRILEIFDKSAGARGPQAVFVDPPP